MVVLAAGAAAGMFSAVFGVGGGTVMVPILIVYLAYDPKAATATSLAAIVPIAVWGTLTHGVLGNVDWTHALLIGLPAMVGVTVGVRVKGRVSSASLTYAFAGLLVVVAGLMVAGV